MYLFARQLPLNNKRIEAGGGTRNKELEDEKEVVVDQVEQAVEKHQALM